MFGIRKLIRPILAVSLLVCAAWPGLAHDQVPGRAPDGPVLLRGADLYTVSQGVLRGQDLLIENGKIAAIGPNLAVPGGAEVIDLAGKRVYPGLIAAVTNMGLSEIGAVRATNDATEIGDVTPEVQSHIAYNPDSEIIPTVRSSGITTTQVVPGGSLLRGQSFVVHLDGWNKEDAGVRMQDGMHLSWPRVSVSRSPRVRESEAEQREAMEKARERLLRLFRDARAYAVRRAADPESSVDLRWEAMLPVLDRSMPLYIHANDYRQIAEAVAFATEENLKTILVGGRDAHLAIDLLKSAEIPIVLGSTQATPSRADEAYDLPFRLPSILEEAGLRWCQAHISWGAWQARNLGYQAGQATGHGLDPAVALRSITLSVAELLGIDDREGSLEVGKDATLFVADGDILDHAGHQALRMWIEGREVDLNDRHKTLYNKYRQRLR